MPAPAPTRLALACLAALSAAGVVGCGDKVNEQRVQARARWDDARARVLEGLASDQLAAGQLEDARKTCDEALAASGRVAAVHLLAARIDVERDDLPAARAALERARLLEPAPATLAEIEHLAGAIAERWQQADRAAEHHRRASELAPSEPGYLIAYAEALMAGGDAPAAAAALAGRATYFEGDAAVRDALGQVRAAQGQHAQAAAAFREASTLAPQDAAVRERLALSLIAAGEPAEAAVLLENLVADPANADRASLHAALGEARLARKQPDAARAAFQKAARLDAGSPATWLGIAKASLDAGELSRADAALRRAAALDPDSPALRLMAGYVRLRQDRPREAMAEFLRAADADPSDPLPHAMVALCLKQLGRDGEAAAHVGRALDLDPADPLALALRDE